MIRLRFKRTKRGFGEAVRDLEIKEKTLKRELMVLGDKTKSKMRDIIAKNKKRPRAGEPKTLENAITVEKFVRLGEFGWGVGNIDKLNSEAVGQDGKPYWRAVNYGSSHMVGRFLPLGIFRPGIAIPNNQAFRKGRWKAGLSTGGGKSYSAKVMKPIPPMKFIERTTVWVGRQFRRIQSTISR